MLNNKLKKFIFEKMIKLAIISVLLFFIIETLFVYYIGYVTNTQSLELAFSMALKSYYHIYILFILLGYFISAFSFILLKIRYKKRAENYIFGFLSLIFCFFLYLGVKVSHYLYEENNVIYSQDIPPCKEIKPNKIECENGYKYVFKSDFKIDKRVPLKNTLFIQ